MPRRTLFTLLIAAFLLPCTGCWGPESDSPAPPFAAPDSMAMRELLADAPEHSPVLPFIKKELVDYIDLTASSGTNRTVLEDGRSRIITDSIGTYRETGRSQGSFFNLRFHAPAYNKPHVVVIEYPDNRDRFMAFGIVENDMRPGCGTDHHIETGIYTGGTLPLSRRMQYHSFLLWPQEEWPVLYCANLGNSYPAAASRIWVYRVTAPLPAPEITVPDSVNYRRIGPYIENYRAALTHYGRGPGTRRFFIDYLNMLGCNLLAAGIAGKDGIACRTGYFGDNADELDTLLRLCDRNRIDLTAVFRPSPAVLKTRRHSGVPPAERWRDALLDFIGTYSTHSALHGIALGGAVSDMDSTFHHGDAMQQTLAVALVDKGYPVQQYVFLDSPYETAIPPITAWEKGRQPYGYYLAQQAAKMLKKRELRPNNYWYRQGITPVRIWHAPSGNGMLPYPGTGYDRFTAPALRYTAAPEGIPAAACIIRQPSFYPLCLQPSAGHSWYGRDCIAPQPAGGDRHFLRQLAVPLAHADTDIMLLGGSLPGITGGETHLRNFIRAFRSLPARPFKTVTGKDAPVVARILYRRGRTYFYFINTLPDPVKLTVRIGDFQTISHWVTEHPFNIKHNLLRLTLEPYELAVFHANGGFDLRKVRYSLPATVTDRISSKLTAYRTLLEQAGKAKIKLHKRYRSLLHDADLAFRRRRFIAADQLLAAGPADKIRLHLSQGPGKALHECPHIDTNIRLDGRLDDWKRITATRSVKREEQLLPGGHAPNHWRGTDDFRADFKLAHRNGTLYLAAEITDDVVRMGEEIRIHLTRRNQRGTADTLRYDYTETVYCAPVDADTLVLDLKGGGRSFTRRTERGYMVEARIPLTVCGPGGDSLRTPGCMLMFCDTDTPEPAARCGTEMPDNIFIWPASAGRFRNPQDPRGAIELQLRSRP